jgi:hypothetical protein
MDQDSCRRAAQAAIEVVREECGDRDVEIREIEDGMFMEIPSDVAQMMDDAGESPVPLQNFERVVDNSGFVRSWLAGVVGADIDADADASNQSYADRVFTFASSIFDDGLDFTAEDLRGSDALEMIARSE